MNPKKQVKRCPVCHIAKPRKEFGEKRGGTIKGVCKVCRIAALRSKYKSAPYTPAVPRNKVCPACSVSFKSTGRRKFCSLQCEKQTNRTPYTPKIRHCVVCSARIADHGSKRCSGCRKTYDRERMRLKRASPDYDNSKDMARLANWKRNNPERAHFANTHQDEKRRKAYRATERIITAAEWRATLAAFDSSCAYCGKEWQHRDHLIPIAMGGDYGKLNIVPACAKCNLDKGAKNPFQFAGAPEAFMTLLETHL